MNVELIRTNGTILDVVNAARVSFNKESEEFNDNDKKLIKYLAKHKHTAPFNHVGASFRIKAPIFVARQLAKHQIGLAWNEVSRRYVKDEPEFYFPEEWREAAENIKQGSSEEVLTGDLDLKSTLIANMCHGFCNEAYNTLIAMGVCPEQARMVLPQSMITEWIWTGSLTAFARVCALRLDPHTQKETREVAAKISTYLTKAFPNCFSVLLNSMDESYNYKGE